MDRKKIIKAISEKSAGSSDDLKIIYAQNLGLMSDTSLIIYAQNIGLDTDAILSTVKGA